MFFRILLCMSTYEQFQYIIFKLWNHICTILVYGLHLYWNQVFGFGLNQYLTSSPEHQLDYMIKNS